MIRKKPAPDLIRGGCRFSEKIMRLEPRFKLAGNRLATAQKDCCTRGRQARIGPDYPSFMALTQRLQIRQSQALVMTPQLMQAIKLLQLSNLDLVAYVEAELERNPLLDRSAEAEPPPSPAE